MGEDAARAVRVRLDVWLDVACLYRTRSEAQKACHMGRVEVNGQRAKPHRELRAGDTLVVQRALGRRQQFIVRVLTDRHVPKADARQMYEDVTPPPSPEQVELRRLAALAKPFRPAAKAPDKRQRRALRRVKERGYDDEPE